jgi:hypothetical protein
MRNKTRRLSAKTPDDENERALRDLFIGEAPLKRAFILNNPLGIGSTYSSAQKEYQFLFAIISFSSSGCQRAASVLDIHAATLGTR